MNRSCVSLNITYIFTSYIILYLSTLIEANSYKIYSNLINDSSLIINNEYLKPNKTFNNLMYDLDKNIINLNLGDIHQYRYNKHNDNVNNKTNFKIHSNFINEQNIVTTHNIQNNDFICKNLNKSLIKIYNITLYDFYNNNSSIKLISSKYINNTNIDYIVLYNNTYKTYINDNNCISKLALDVIKENNNKFNINYNSNSFLESKIKVNNTKHNIISEYNLLIKEIALLNKYIYFKDLIDIIKHYIQISNINYNIYLDNLKDKNNYFNIQENNYNTKINYDYYLKSNLMKKLKIFIINNNIYLTEKNVYFILNKEYNIKNYVLNSSSITSDYYNNTNETNYINVFFNKIDLAGMVFIYKVMNKSNKLNIQNLYLITIKLNKLLFESHILDNIYLNFCNFKYECKLYKPINKNSNNFTLDYIIEYNNYKVIAYYELKYNTSSVKLSDTYVLLDKSYYYNVNYRKYNDIYYQTNNIIHNLHHFENKICSNKYEYGDKRIYYNNTNTKYKYINDKIIEYNKPNIKNIAKIINYSNIHNNTDTLMKDLRNKFYNHTYIDLEVDIYNNLNFKLSNINILNKLFKYYKKTTSLKQIDRTVNSDIKNYKNNINIYNKLEVNPKDTFAFINLKTQGTLTCLFTYNIDNNLIMTYHLYNLQLNKSIYFYELLANIKLKNYKHIYIIEVKYNCKHNPNQNNNEYSILINNDMILKNINIFESNNKLIFKINNGLLYNAKDINSKYKLNYKKDLNIKYNILSNKSYIDKTNLLIKDVGNINSFYYNNYIVTCFIYNKFKYFTLFKLSKKSINILNYVKYLSYYTNLHNNKNNINLIVLMMFNPYLNFDYIYYNLNFKCLINNKLNFDFKFKLYKDNLLGYCDFKSFQSIKYIEIIDKINVKLIFNHNKVSHVLIDTILKFINNYKKEFFINNSNAIKLAYNKGIENYKKFKQLKYANIYSSYKINNNNNNNINLISNNKRNINAYNTIQYYVYLIANNIKKNNNNNNLILISLKYNKLLPKLITNNMSLLCYNKNTKGNENMILTEKIESSNNEVYSYYIIKIDNLYYQTNKYINYDYEKNLHYIYLNCYLNCDVNTINHNLNNKLIFDLNIPIDNNFNKKNLSFNPMKLLAKKSYNTLYLNNIKKDNIDNKVVNKTYKNIVSLRNNKKEKLNTYENYIYDIYNNNNISYLDNKIILAKNVKSNSLNFVINDNLIDLDIFSNEKYIINDSYKYNNNELLYHIGSLICSIKDKLNKKLCIKFNPIETVKDNHKYTSTIKNKNNSNNTIDNNIEIIDYKENIIQNKNIITYFIKIRINKSLNEFKIKDNCQIVAKYTDSITYDLKCIYYKNISKSKSISLTNSFNLFKKHLSVKILTNNNNINNFVELKNYILKNFIENSHYKYTHTNKIYIKNYYLINVFNDKNKPQLIIFDNISKTNKVVYLNELINIKNIISNKDSHINIKMNNTTIIIKLKFEYLSLEKIKSKLNYINCKKSNIINNQNFIKLSKLISNKTNYINLNKSKFTIANNKLYLINKELVKNYLNDYLNSKIICIFKDRYSNNLIYSIGLISYYKNLIACDIKMNIDILIDFQLVIYNYKQNNLIRSQNINIKLYTIDYSRYIKHISNLTYKKSNSNSNTNISLLLNKFKNSILLTYLNKVVLYIDNKIKNINNNSNKNYNNKSIILINKLSKLLLHKSKELFNYINNLNKRDIDYNKQYFNKIINTNTNDKVDYIDINNKSLKLTFYFPKLNILHSSNTFANSSLNYNKNLTVKNYYNYKIKKYNYSKKSIRAIKLIVSLYKKLNLKNIVNPLINSEKTSLNLNRNSLKNFDNIISFNKIFKFNIKEFFYNKKQTTNKVDYFSNKTYNFTHNKTYYSYFFYYRDIKKEKVTKIIKKNNYKAINKLYEYVDTNNSIYSFKKNLSYYIDTVLNSNLYARISNNHVLINDNNNIYFEIKFENSKYDIYRSFFEYKCVFKLLNKTSEEYVSSAYVYINSNNYVCELPINIYDQPVFNAIYTNYDEKISILKNIVYLNILKINKFNLQNSFINIKYLNNNINKYLTLNLHAKRTIENSLLFNKSINEIENNYLYKFDVQGYLTDHENIKGYTYLKLQNLFNILDERIIKCEIIYNKTLVNNNHNANINVDNKFINKFSCLALINIDLNNSYSVNNYNIQIINSNKVFYNLVSNVRFIPYLNTSIKNKCIRHTDNIIIDIIIHKNNSYLDKLNKDDDVIMCIYKYNNKEYIVKTTVFIYSNIDNINILTVTCPNDYIKLLSHNGYIISSNFLVNVIIYKKDENTKFMNKYFTSPIYIKIKDINSALIKNEYQISSSLNTLEVNFNYNINVISKNNNYCKFFINNSTNVETNLLILYYKNKTKIICDYYTSSNYYNIINYKKSSLNINVNGFNIIKDLVFYSKQIIDLKNIVVPFRYIDNFIYSSFEVVLDNNNYEENALYNLNNSKLICNTVDLNNSNKIIVSTKPIVIYNYKSKIYEILCITPSNYDYLENNKNNYIHKFNFDLDYNLSDSNVISYINYIVIKDTDIKHIIYGIDILNIKVSHYNNVDRNVYLPKCLVNESIEIDYKNDACIINSNIIVNKELDKYNNTIEINNNFNQINNNNDNKSNSILYNRQGYEIKTIKLGYPEIGYSLIDTIIYILNPVIESISPNLGPYTGGTNVVIKGKNFIPKDRIVLKILTINSFNFKETNRMIYPYYQDSKKLLINIPKIDYDEINFYSFKISIDNVNFVDAKLSKSPNNDIDNKMFLFYEDIIIESIYPNLSFYDVDIVVKITANNVINNEHLSCKINNYVSIVDHYVYIDGKHIVYCRVPRLSVVNPNVDNLIGSNKLVYVYLSNNNQQYSSGIEFQYITYNKPLHENFRYSPTFGPSTINTEVTFTANDFYEGIDLRLRPINAYCIAGNKNITANIIDENNIKCTLPTIDDYYKNTNYNILNDNYNKNELIDNIFIVYNTDRQIAIINLYLDLLYKRIKVSFTYNLDIKVNSFFPDNLEVSKEGYIDIIGSGFYYYSFINCKLFLTNDNKYLISSAVFYSYNLIRCYINDNVSHTIQQSIIHITFNGVHYHTFNDIIKIDFRNKENIKSLEPVVLPSNSINLITIQANYFYDIYSKYAVFVLYEKINNNYVKLLKRKIIPINYISDASRSANISVELPVLNISGDYYVNISSNSMHYSDENYNKITFYKIPEILSVSKKLLAVNYLEKTNIILQLSNSVYINGYSSNNQFELVFECIESINKPSLRIINKDYTIIDNKTISYYIDTSRCLINTQLKLATKYETSYYYYKGYISTYRIPVIEDVFPKVILKDTTKILVLKTKENFDNSNLFNDINNFKLYSNYINSFLKCVFTYKKSNNKYYNLYVKAKNFNYNYVICNINNIGKNIEDTDVIKVGIVLYNTEEVSNRVKVSYLEKYPKIIEFNYVQIYDKINYKLEVKTNWETDILNNSSILNKNPYSNLIPLFSIYSQTYTDKEEFENPYENKFTLNKLSSYLIKGVFNNSNKNNEIIGSELLFLYKEKGFIEGLHSIDFTYNFLDWIEFDSDNNKISILNCSHNKKCYGNNYYNLLSFSKESVRYSDANVELFNENCPNGSYCQFGSSVQCSPGYYSDKSTNKESCKKCSSDRYCPNQGLTTESFIPRGYYNNYYEGLMMESQMYICPEGYYCPSNSNSTIVCIEGKYCPLGTYSNIISYKAEGISQQCRDGVFCGKHSDTESGSKNSFGTLQCSDGVINDKGYICKRGKRNDCPKGHSCLTETILEPERCLAGTFYNITEPHKDCYTCPVGSQCKIEGSIEPTPCEKGYMCRYSHQFSPSRLCSMGSYCLGAIVGRPSKENTIPNAIPEKYQPVKCHSGQFCFIGVNTDITNSTDILSPQQCIDGMVCTIEDDDLLISLQCPAGYYCIAGNPPTPAEPGYYVPGEGSTKQQACPLGTFSNTIAATKCIPCPAGSYNPYEAKTKCEPCPKGQYRESDSNNIFCSLCPAGTYNPNIGKTSIDDCIPCPPKKFCPSDGLDNIDNAKPCKAGYVCKGGTHELNIEKCPAGFYCDINSSEEADYMLCPEGFYCDEGTTIEDKYKNPCPANYFCYKGSKSKLLDGSFNGIYLSDIIDKVIDAKNMKGKYDDPDIANEVRCEEDNKIPYELIIEYLNKRSEKCPEGTTSIQGAQCLGKCTIDGSYSSKIIPFLEDELNNQEITELKNNENLDKDNNNKSSTDINSNMQSRVLNLFNYRYLDESNLEVTVESDLNKKNDNILTSKQSTIFLESFSHIIVSFNFSEIPSFLEFMNHYSIYIEIIDLNNSNSLGKKQDLPEILNPENFNIYKLEDTSNKMLTLKVYNSKPEDLFLKVSININNSLFDSLSKIFKNIASFKKYLPGRAYKNTNKIFFFILIKSIFEKITLPYNLYFNAERENNKGLIVNYIPNETEKMFTYPRYKGQSSDPYDEQFWDKSKQDAVVLNWLPFYSNCAGYDKNIYLYDLLEHSPQCKFPNDNELKIVREFPTQGFSPVSDYCNIELYCRYDEKMNTSTGKFIRWFLVNRPTTIAYVTTDPHDKIEAENNPSKNKEFIDQIENMELSFIPVIIYPIEFKQDCAPINHYIKINYYQVDKEQKRLVSFEIELSNYTKCKSEATSRFENEIFYSVAVEYRGINYLELVNKFQFNLPIYVFVFSLISLLIIITILIIWFFIYLKSKLQKPPTFKLKFFIINFIYPCIKGFTLAAIIASLIIVFSFILKSYGFMQNINVTFDDLQDEAKEEDYPDINNKRTGLSFLIFYFSLIYYSTNVLIQRPERHEDEELKRDAILKDQFENNSEKEVNIKILNEEDKVILQDIDNQSNPLLWKRKSVILKSIFIIVYNAIKFEFSYSETFTKNVYLFYAFFIFLEYLIEESFNKLIFGEALLSSSYITLNRIVSNVIILGAIDFKAYVLLYIIKCYLNFLLRIYIDPIIDKIIYIIRINIEKKVEKCNKDIASFFKEKLKNKTNLDDTNLNNNDLYQLKNFDANKLFLNYNLTLSFKENIILKVHKIRFVFWSFILFFFFKENEVNDKYFNLTDKFYNEERTNTIEIILRVLQNLSSNLLSTMFTPILITIAYIYNNQLKFTFMYNIRNTDLKYYILYTFVLIIPEILISLIIIHIIELFYGLRIQEYIVYLNYRFKIRKTEFINIKDSIDPAINLTWRSFDAFLLSEQFYLVSTIVVLSSIFGIFSILIVVRLDYNPFNDPITFIFIIMIVCVFYIGKVILLLVTKVFKMWKIKEINELKEGNFLDFLYKKSNLKDIQSILNTDLFKHKFLNVNKNWILSNLENILGVKENEGDLDKDINKNLQEVYQKAINYDAIEKHIINKREDIKKDLQLMPYNQPFIGNLNNEFGIRLDITNDSDNDLVVEMPISKKKDLQQDKCKYLKNVTMIWYNKGKELIKFKRWSYDYGLKVLNSKKKCDICSSKFNLQLIQENSLFKLLKLFKEENEGKYICKDLWECYFKVNQKFYVYCMECAYMHNFKKIKEKKIINNVVKQSNVINDKNIIKKFNKPFVLGILHAWLFEARSKILFDKLNNKIIRTTKF